MKQKNKRKPFLRVLVIVFVSISAAAIWCVFFTALAISSFRSLNLADAQKKAQLATPIWAGFSVLTGKQSADIELAYESTKLISTSTAASDVVQQLQTEPIGGSIDISSLAEYVQTHQSSLEHIAKLLPKSSLLPMLIGKEHQQQLHTISQVTPDLLEALTLLSSGHHKYVTVFQNSDELRATGGFMGSYAVIEIQDGVIAPISIEDIYDADGQFQGYVQAPTGVKEFLSSNNGLRLPDANWDPDFSASAETILQFFAFGSRQNIDGVIAINDQVFKSLLSITGPIWLPDYQTSVTEANLTAALRSNRNDFFAGSIQKKHLLTQFKNQFLNAVYTKPQNLVSIVSTLREQAEQKNIMIYSHNPKLQPLINAYGLNGAVFTHPELPGLAFVESNVGINKANSGVSREIELAVADQSLIATITYHNTNKPPLSTQLQEYIKPDFVKTASASATHLAYVNYQRVLYPTTWQLKNIVVDSQKLESWDQEPYLTLSQYQPVTQVGFLSLTREKETTTVRVEFTLPQHDKNWELELYKQPGIAPVPYTLRSNQQNDTFLLEKNRVTMLP